MKNFFNALGFFAFFAILIYLLFHPKHWWKTWIVVIGLYVIGSYGKAYHEEHRDDNYDRVPGSVIFQENLENGNWR
jgi:1,4-dihydroxy-2-naphthoate octaprenyltransferase|tara:strand:+ start:297 stop:524 length:228 start_codon:yes stop_codon:yes gene_type:complete